MLPAVQSLRLACSEGRTPTGSCVMLLGTGGAASGSRDPRLLIGRPYGTGACGEISGGTLLPLWGLWGEFCLVWFPVVSLVASLNPRLGAVIPAG
jgi:hypothetical protein